jgi:hypothetical protein
LTQCAGRGKLPVMSKEPLHLYLSRVQNGCRLFVGNEERHSAREVAHFAARWKIGWSVNCSLVAGLHSIHCELLSDVPTKIRFRGASVRFMMPDTQEAEVRICRLDEAYDGTLKFVVMRGYQITARAGMICCKLTAHLDQGELHTYTTVGDQVILESPSKYASWTEDAVSLLGFRRFKWGDFVDYALIDAPASEALLVLFCLGIHNSLLAGTILDDPPVG